MSQYQGHPPPGYQHWPQQYTGHPHGIPNGPYSSPGTAVSAAGAAATAGPRPGQVCLALQCARVDDKADFRTLEPPRPLSGLFICANSRVPAA